MIHDINPDEPIRCLVVDDDSLTHALLSFFLENQGFATLAARSGEDGVQKALAWQPDLIFMDVEMPGISGLEATAQIRTEPALAYHPVVIGFTSHESPEIQADCLAAGMDDFVRKPFHSEKIQDVLERWGAVPNAV